MLYGDVTLHVTLKTLSLGYLGTFSRHKSHSNSLLDYRLLMDLLLCKPNRITIRVWVDRYQKYPNHLQLQLFSCTLCIIFSNTRLFPHIVISRLTSGH
ncbi:hypothetical protein XENTR_v10020324 [Xenopus tropicalis]|nr:hypothetical protein XENTR_v10020324 [Xenopus tropicalis]